MWALFVKTGRAKERKTGEGTGKSNAAAAARTSQPRRLKASLWPLQQLVRRPPKEKTPLVCTYISIYRHRQEMYDISLTYMTNPGYRSTHIYLSGVLRTTALAGRREQADEKKKTKQREYETGWRTRTPLTPSSLCLPRVRPEDAAVSER